MSLPPVVLLHGLATTSQRTWGETGWVDILADAGRSAIPVDLPGHGPGRHSTDPEDYRDFDDDVAGRLPDGVVDAIGFSLGARTLLAIAAARPQRFRRLVVAGIGGGLFDGDSDRGSAWLADRLEDADSDVPAVHHFRQLAEAASQPIDVLTAVLRRPAAGPFDAGSLARVTAPTLVVVGDRDPAGPAEPLVDRLPHGTGVTLRGVDHVSTPRSFDFIDAAIGHLEIDDR